MTDHNNTEETDGQNSSISRRAAVTLLGTGAVGGAAATSAYSELRADRPIDVEVTDDEPDTQIGADASVLQITNYSGNTIEAHITVDDTDYDDLLVRSVTNGTIEGSGPWDLTNLSDQDTSEIEFEHFDDEETGDKSVTFTIEGFSDTSGFSITSTILVNAAEGVLHDTDPDIYLDQETVRDTWDTLYEFEGDSGRIEIGGTEPETVLEYGIENGDLESFNKHVVGDFEGSFSIEQGVMGLYEIEEREDDGYYWITAESTASSEDDWIWAASTVVDFEPLSEINFRFSNDDTGRGTSGYEIGIEGNTLDYEDESNDDTTVGPIDVSDINTVEELFVISVGQGNHDAGTRMSLTELELVAEEVDFETDYTSQEAVRDEWNTLYEISGEDLPLPNEGEAILEETDHHPLSDFEVGDFEDSFNITHGEMGEYIVEEREDDGFYWITAQSDDSDSDDFAWMASAGPYDFDELDSVTLRWSGDNTDRASSGFEVGIEGTAFDLVGGTAQEDTEETYDTSDISGEHEMFIVASGKGNHDEGTRVSLTELSEEE